MHWLAVSIFGWGTTFLAIDIALTAAPLSVVAAARPLAGAVMLLLPLLLRGRRLPRSMIGWSLLIGFLNTTLVTVAAVVGTASVGPGLSAVLVNSSPFLIAVMAAVILRESVTREIKIATVLGFVGIVAITFHTSGDQWSRAPNSWGLLALILGAVGFASASIIVRYIARDRPEVDLLVLTGWQLLFGGLFVLPFAVKDSAAVQWDSPTLWAAFLYLGLTAAAMWGWFKALESIGAARAGSFVFLVPVVTLSIEIVRANYPSALQTIGIFLILLAIWIVTRRGVVGNVSDLHHRVFESGAG